MKTQPILPTSASLQRYQQETFGKPVSDNEHKKEISQYLANMESYLDARWNGEMEECDFMEALFEIRDGLCDLFEIEK